MNVEFSWGTTEIKARLHLNDEQRVDLAVLQHMSELAGNTLNFDCQPDESLGPPDRLATAETRIEAMLDAIKQVAPALDDFLSSLNDAQKARVDNAGVLTAQFLVSLFLGPILNPTFPKFGPTVASIVHVLGLLGMIGTFEFFVGF